MSEEVEEAAGSSRREEPIVPLQKGDSMPEGLDFRNEPVSSCVEPLNMTEGQMAAYSNLGLRIVLGPTGAGKSASGNTILRRDVFKTDLSFKSVTKTCEKDLADVVSRNVSMVSVSLNVVLLGPNGSGKTSTANGMLGRKAFPESPTTVCRAKRGEFQGRGIRVIDTPGLQESDKVKREIKRTLNMVHDAPTVFLFVIGLSKTNSGKWEFYIKLTEEIFGKDAMSKIMILYIKRETLQQVGVEDILNSVEAQNLTRCCGGWYHIMNSKAELGSSDVEELLWKMKRMIHSSADVRIVLLGKTGAGKSSSGNTILGREAFTSDNTLDSVTATSHRELGVVGGRHVSLVDTPGLFDTKKNKDVVKGEIEKCVDLSVPGPHVFLVVMRLDVSHTQEEKDAIKWIQDNFGQGAAKFTMVLFTRADQLRGKSVEDMLTVDLKTLISSCSGYHAFNNEVREDNTQVKEILCRIRWRHPVS